VPGLGGARGLPLTAKTVGPTMAARSPKRRLISHTTCVWRVTIMWARHGPDMAAGFFGRMPSRPPIGVIAARIITGEPTVLRRHLTVNVLGKTRAALCGQS